MSLGGPLMAAEDESRVTRCRDGGHDAQMAAAMVLGLAGTWLCRSAAVGPLGVGRRERGERNGHARDHSDVGGEAVETNLG